jgi:cytochrome P450
VGRHPLGRYTLSLKLSTCPLFDTRDVNITTSIAYRRDTATAAPPKLLNRASEIGFLVASLRGKPHKYLERLQKRHGENFIIRPNIVVLNNPHAIRDVLETHNLPKTPKVRFGYKSIFYGTRSRSSGGILAAPWNTWIEQRRMAAPALSEAFIGKLAPKFHQVSVPFFDYLEANANSNSPVDMSEAFTAVTMDAIGSILLGRSFGLCDQLQSQEGQRGVPFAEALHTLTGE